MPANLPHYAYDEATQTLTICANGKSTENQISALEKTSDLQFSQTFFNKAQTAAHIQITFITTMAWLDLSLLWLTLRFKDNSQLKSLVFSNHFFHLPAILRQRISQAIIASNSLRKLSLTFSELGVAFEEYATQKSDFTNPYWMLTTAINKNRSLGEIYIQAFAIDIPNIINIFISRCLANTRIKRINTKVLLIEPHYIDLTFAIMRDQSGVFLQLTLIIGEQINCCLLEELSFLIKNIHCRIALMINFLTEFEDPNFLNPLWHSIAKSTIRAFKITGIAALNADALKILASSSHLTDIAGIELSTNNIHCHIVNRLMLAAQPIISRPENITLHDQIKIDQLIQEYRTLSKQLSTDYNPSLFAERILLLYHLRISALLYELSLNFNQAKLDVTETLFKEALEIFYCIDPKSNHYNDSMLPMLALKFQMECHREKSKISAWVRSILIFPYPDLQTFNLMQYNFYIKLLKQVLRIPEASIDINKHHIAIIFLILSHLKHRLFDEHNPDLAPLEAELNLILKHLPLFYVDTNYDKILSIFSDFLDYLLSLNFATIKEYDELATFGLQNLAVLKTYFTTYIQDMLPDLADEPEPLNEATRAGRSCTPP